MESVIRSECGVVVLNLPLLELLSWLSGLTNLTGIHEDWKLIPGLIQWLKDLELQRAKV